MIPALERGDFSPQKRIAPFDRIAISERDRRIVALARQKLGETTVDFGEAVRALREAVEELIPAGRTFVLGIADLTPVVGSLVSGVGITAGAEGVILVRMEHDGRRTTLGRFSP
ncbi:hypothetical protein [Sorangium sp. So ce1335]|uniref:hypothetical protein n=1 Tax=Sorangium sp. So ce1335 TaxID=3133335 RepID=UPI003F63D425